MGKVSFFNDVTHSDTQQTKHASVNGRNIVLMCRRGGLKEGCEGSKRL